MVLLFVFFFIIEDLNYHSKSLSFLFSSSFFFFFFPFLNSFSTTFPLHVEFGTVGLGQTESAD